MLKVSILAVLLSSLAVRFWVSVHLDFGVDQQAIYEMGKAFYLTGQIPAVGPKLVYTGESIPGGFQAILAGLPLFLTRGEPIGLQLWVGFLNWVAMTILFLWLRTKIQKPSEGFLLLFLMFSPWSILFSPSWNPSFLPVFSVPFFILLDQILKKPEKTNGKSSFFLGLLLQLTFQLHLSAVLLGLCALLALFKIRRQMSFLIFSFLGFLSGSVFLIPWILEKAQGGASFPVGVIGIHPENLVGALGAIFRYFSFPTSEISRFLGDKGQGFQGMLNRLEDQTLLWLPALAAFLGSAVLVGLVLKRWLLLGFRSFQSSSGISKFEQIEFWIPLIMPLFFVFSIKGASAHTFWILMPLSFYSMVKALEPILVSETTIHQLLFSVYLFSSVSLTLFAVLSS